MAFWDIVDEELKYKGMTRKALASEAGFNLGNVGKGIKRGSSPSADTAVKIAKVLGVTVEYLVSGSDSPDAKASQKKLNEELELFRKYRPLVEKINNLSPKAQEALSTLADKMQGL